MSQEVTDEELAAALAAAVDEDGNDIRLADAEQVTVGLTRVTLLRSAPSAS